MNYWLVIGEMEIACGGELLSLFIFLCIYLV